MRRIEVGDIAELVLATALAKAGYVVLQPIGRQRYDLVIERDDGRFLRVQVKNGRLRDGAVRFNTASCGGYSRAARRSYRGEADYFGVYCEEVEGCYLIPVEAVGKAEGCLRLDPCRNGQQAGIRLAADFKI